MQKSDSQALQQPQGFPDWHDGRIHYGLDNGLALTPQMGFNTWNHYGCSINETLIKDTADAMVSTGLLAMGYEYLNLDDCWMASSRNAQGELYGDPTRFPSGMASLGEYIHGAGLLYGVYSSAGYETCAGYPASLGYETTDADTWAGWEVDYLKYDNCNSDGSPPIDRYTTMRNALNQSGRTIFFSMCEWGVDDPATWATPIGNSWRTTGDISDTWDSVMDKITSQDQWYKYAAPGGWNDPDMLEVGNGGLSYDEEVSHFSLWALAKAPLLIGCDVTSMSQQTLDIFLNKDVVAISQDSLGIQGNLRSAVPFPAGPPAVGSSLANEVCSSSKSDFQQWVLAPFSQGGPAPLQLASNTSLCLTPQGTSAASLQPCSGANNQKWTPKYTDSTNTVFSLVASNGACLDLYNSNTDDGAYIGLFGCNGQTNQQWSIASDGASLTSQVNSYCVSVADTVGSAQVWAGPLSGGRVAMVLLNNGAGTNKVTANWTDVGLSGPATLYDVWTKENLGTFDGSYSATLDTHASNTVIATPN